MEVVMKAKMFLMSLLMFFGSYANASTVLVGNGVSWTTSIEGVGTQTGEIRLMADTSGADFKGGLDAYLAGIGIKDIGGLFTITSIDLLGWDDNNDELSAAGKACDSGTSSAANRACAFAGTPGDRVLSSTGPLTIVIGVALTTGALNNNFHFKVRWEDLAGNKVGSLISDDLTAVPLPAAVWLFGSALMGLTVVARRRDRKAPLVA
jgi:hypothetical protein